MGESETALLVRQTVVHPNVILATRARDAGWVIRETLECDRPFGAGIPPFVDFGMTVGKREICTAAVVIIRGHIAPSGAGAICSTDRVEDCIINTVRMLVERYKR